MTVAVVEAGMVVATEWLPAPDGRQYRAFAGRVEILGAEATLGISPGERDQTWYARVTGRKGVAYLPGCKVAAVFDTLHQSVQDAEVWQ